MASSIAVCGLLLLVAITGGGFEVKELKAPKVEEVRPCVRCL